MCCAIVDGISCTETAEFEILENTRTDPDNYTDSCRNHIGHLLGTADIGHETTECRDWTVSII